MRLSNQFQPHPKTIQLELSGGGALGRYECGALVELLPFWKAQGYQIKIITSVSAGAMNGALTSYALNTNQEDRLTEIYNGFWNDVSRKGDLFLKPMLDFYSAANSFNPLKSPFDEFPNIPRHLVQAMKLGGKSSLPLSQLKELLKTHIPPEGWDAIRNGQTETFVSTLRIDGITGERHPVLFTGKDLNPDTVVASGALRDFAEYRLNGEVYEDGGYHNIGFFMKEHSTDVLFAIGLKPLRNVAEIEDHRGVKTGQLHHDLARYYLDPDRKTHIDFICLDHPDYWNETSAMNNTSKHIEALYDMGRQDARKWIAEHGATFGQKSSFTPSQALLNVVAPQMALKAA